ncbi:hypothetical protein A1O3_01000 [Capronia epimyces CBS 606.96]|uniref:Sec39 domain-containing protein n=1 Tax=Capronia epimyces CBS 606.96 TaxID=1182542 RepID=W9ZD63_9EURO|nr:uncharacterized protein A1O3_01000 [Capronia epimyces CBS 606.96]EXJ92449.1 hypothetical protein A1O3_01000 [Capronia epimyces CBS 606.96]
MATLHTLTGAHIVLLAVQLASEGDLKGLQRVVRGRRDVLSDTLIYRLLLSFYPAEVSEQSDLVKFLKSLRNLPPDSADNAETDTDTDTDEKIDPSLSHLPKKEAFDQCRALRLRHIPEHASIDTNSTLANFIIEWAKGLELISGATQPPLHFVEQFLDDDEDLRLWYETYLVPVVRLQYEFYPENEKVVGVQELETLSGAEGVQTLLQYAERQNAASAIVRDLDYVVAPWVRGAHRAKRRKVQRPGGLVTAENASWEAVNEWLVASSLVDFSVAASVFIQWNGPVQDPQPTDEGVTRFAQIGLAIIYGCSKVSPETQSMSRQVLDKAARSAGLKPPDFSRSPPEVSLPPSFSKGFDEADLLQSSLSRNANPFTHVDEASVNLLVGLLYTADILLGLGQPVAITDVARICVFGSELRHEEELRRLLQHIPRMTRKAIDWRLVRRDLLWLQTWSSTRQLTSQAQQPAFLSRLSPDYVERQILDALLRASQYDIVKEVYIDTTFLPLKVPDVEDRIVAAILEAYDNASNGNKDRGGMKRAHEILRAFRPLLPQSSSLPGIDHLIRATHSLSFYQLTLQHGVPFKPVAIRVQKDPLTLVEKVLEQDAKAYTKLDDLLEIGRNLVRAYLPKHGTMPDDLDPIKLRVSDAEHRITYSAVMAALAADDFHTAYAYITTRLSISPTRAIGAGFADDTSWRAAYAAGRYRPQAPPNGLKARIDSLAQRMELLSRALMLAPSGDALAGILATWRRYEEEMDGLKTQAMEEERAFDAHADASLPGAFALEDRDADAAETTRVMARRSGPGTATGPSYEEEAPMGLFDVARGAAAAFRKSAIFPLGPSGLQDLKIREAAPPPNGQSWEETAPAQSTASGKVRKRDMVTNMVTSGLVSGMGWVLGAQPQDRVDRSTESFD